MKRIFNLVLLLTTLSIGIAQNCCAQETFQSHYGEIDSDYFRIAMSEGWYSINNEFIEEVYSITYPSAGLATIIQPTINFVKLSFEDFGVTEEELFTINDSDLLVMFPNSVIEEKKEAVVLNRKAFQIQIITEQEGIPVRMMMSIFLYQGDAYNFTYIAEKEEFIDVKQEVLDIYSTFEFVAEADIPEEAVRVQKELLIFDDLYFMTDVEETHFDFFKQRKGKQTVAEQEKELVLKESFSLLFSVGNTEFEQLQQMQEQYFDFLEKLAQDIPPKKRQKKIQEIFDLVHEVFFDEYIENVLFYKIFENKTYNCVTASALYAIAFEYLDIPYVIKEMPSHVYLIAYPDDNRIVLETTNSNFGFLPLNQSQMKKRKKFLQSNGFISDEAAFDMDAEKIYAEEYGKDSDISLTNLIGILYYNNSILKSDSLQFDKALIELEKGKVLYTLETIQDWEHSLAYSILEEEESNLTLNQFCIMADKIYVASSYMDISNQEYQDYFLFLLTKVSNGNSERNASEEFIQCLSERLDNPELIASLDYESKMLLAEKYFFSGEIETAMSILKEHHINDEASLTLVKACVMTYLREFEISESIFETINQVKIDFTILEEAVWLDEIDSFCSLELSTFFFMRDKPTKGQQYLGRFLKGTLPDELGEHDQLLIDNLFAEASAYYVRNENYPEAENYLRKGLALNADSIMLNRKLKVLLDFWKK